MMNVARQLTLFAFYAGLLWPLSLGAQVQAEPPVPLEVEAAAVFASEKEDALVVLVTLRNRALGAPLTNIAVELTAGKQPAVVQTLASLQPGQAQVMSFVDVALLAGKPHLLIKYEWNGQSNALARGVPIPPLSPSNSLWNVLIPSLCGAGGSLLGVLIGGWLTHRLTSQREQERIQFEWNKMRYDKYEAAYRTFLNGWAGNPSAALLQAQYGQLQRDGFIPGALDAKYNATLAVLRRAGATDQEKQEACRGLRQAVESFVADPSQFL